MEGVLRQSLLLAGFVVGMMLLVEWVNVATRGRWREVLGARRWRQYAVCAGLGAAPGCLGAFTVAAMHMHGQVTVGAVVAAMVASSGDEAFVMLALIPKTAVVLGVVLAALGVGAGAAADWVAKRVDCAGPACEAMELHEEEEGEAVTWERVRRQWRRCTLARGLLALGLAGFWGATAWGWMGVEKDWIRVSLMGLFTACLALTAVAPDHFLEEHLWRHVVLRHAPRILLWTAGALAAAGPVAGWLAVGPEAAESRWGLLAGACALGLIPESGPHLVLVTLYAQGSIPFSVLLANSVVQDGHGMLPVLAHSRKTFAVVKGANLVVGLAVGGAAMAMGF